MLVTRSRPLPFKWGRSREEAVAYDIHTGSEINRVVHWDEPVNPSMGAQTTASEGHPWRGNTNRQGDLGGEFYTEKKEVYCPKKQSTVHYSHVDPGYQTIKTTYTGPLAAFNPRITGYAPAAFFSTSDDDLEELGTTAVSLSKPTNSVADAATFLGELIKDRLPAIPGITTWERKVHALLSVGDEFLNAAFGWLPLLSDIRSHADAIRRAQKVLRQFERDAGKQVRRQFHFDEHSSNDSILVGTNLSPWVGEYGSTSLGEALGHGDVYRTREISRKAWFSGAFTYYLPSGYDSRNKMTRYAREADKLFGTDITPEVLWELTPWSWAIDWFTNAGDVLSNVSDYVKYGLILKYGYIMETTMVKDTYTYVSYGDGTSTYPVDVPPLIMTSTVKKRRKANPFGFGVAWDGLSPFQLAIAGALGLSKGT